MGTDDHERPDRPRINETAIVDDNTSAPTEKIMSATEISNKVYEPKTYEEAITDSIYSW